MSGANSATSPEEKTAKIKRWVAARLEEIEQQNQRLRSQNVLCSKRLELLQNCARNTAEWRTSLMTCSAEGGRFQMVLNNNGNGPTQNVAVSLQQANLGDSGDYVNLIEDEPPPPLSYGAGGASGPPRFVLEWPIVQQQRRTASVERMEPKGQHQNQQHVFYNESLAKAAYSKGVVGQHIGGGIDIGASNTLPRDQSNRRSRIIATVESEKTSSGISMAAALSSPPNHFKPTPKPRSRLRGDPRSTSTSHHHHNHSLMSASAVSSTMDRDSLDTTTSTASFFVNSTNGLADRCSSMASGHHGTNGAPNWEKQLHSLAQSCFFPSSPKHASGDSGNFGALPSQVDSTPVNHRKQQQQQQQQQQLGGPKAGTPRAYAQRISPPISVPVYCVYPTKERLLCQPSVGCESSGGDNSSSQRSSREGRTNSGGSSSNTTGGGGGGPSSSGGGHGRLSVQDARSSSGTSSQQSKGQHSHQGGAGVFPLEEASSSEDEYAVPPDAMDLSDNLAIRCVIKDGNITDFMSTSIEKAGYLNKMGSRTKSWKRRWFSLKDDTLCYYKSSSDQDGGKTALGTIQMTEIIGLTRVTGGHNSTTNGTPVSSTVGMATEGFELVTAKGRFRLTAEDCGANEEWFQVLGRSRKESTLKRLHRGIDGSRIRGWVTKVHFGRSKRFWCALTDQTLLLYKRPTQQVPLSQINVASAQIKETPRSSEDESENEDTSICTNGGGANRQYSLEIRVAEGDPIYLIFCSCEEKEKWFYHLSMAAVGGSNPSTTTPFEKLISRLMEVDGDPENPLWHDPLISTCEETLSSPLTHMDNEAVRKDAIGLYKSVYLFSTAPVHGCAVEYHVDLARNILQKALSSLDIRDELLCQLMKFTNSTLLITQTWRLLALVLSLYTPTRYPVMWLLRKHLQRKSLSGDPRHRFAAFCRRALDRCIRNGLRKEPPSRLEAMAFLTRDPCEHSMPHSIPVHLPDGSYQVVGFDGSSTVDECQQRVCQIAALRPPRISGYVLYADDPLMSSTLQPLSQKEKICDVLSRWEKSLREVTSGKIPTTRTIQLRLRQRYYWHRVVADETEHEKIYLAYQACEEVRRGRMPITVDLVVELASLMAQLHFGPCKNMDDPRIQEAIARVVPEKLLVAACRNTLRQRVAEKWLSLQHPNAIDCAIAIVSVLRVWPYFGAKIFDATLKWKSDEPILLAVSDTNISILHSQTFDQISAYTYEMVLKFGGMKNDFVLVVLRTSCTEDESSQERLVFGMDKLQMYEATLLIADYIKNRRSAHLKQAYLFSPKRQANV